MAQYKYYRPLDWDDRPEPEDCHDLESSWGVEFLEWVAEDAAEDYWDKHDGWECSWPIELLILDTAGRELGLFEVDMESTPQFHAGRITSK